MSDTPETDAAWDKYISPPYTYWAGDLRILAQRLERERNEARQQYDNLATEHMLAVNKLCKELDDAKEALMKIEDLFIDGTNIYADKENMGLIARAALEVLR